MPLSPAFVQMICARCPHFWAVGPQGQDLRCWYERNHVEELEPRVKKPHRDIAALEECPDTLRRERAQILMIPAQSPAPKSKKEKEESQP